MQVEELVKMLGKVFDIGFLRIVWMSYLGLISKLPGWGMGFGVFQTGRRVDVNSLKGCWNFFFDNPAPLPHEKLSANPFFIDTNECLFSSMKPTVQHARVVPVRKFPRKGLRETSGRSCPGTWSGWVSLTQCFGIRRRSAGKSFTFTCITNRKKNRKPVNTQFSTVLKNTAFGKTYLKY